MGDKEKGRDLKGFALHLKKKKKNKTITKQQFFHPNIEHKNRLMLFWPSRKNKVSQGHAPALSSFTWLSGKPFARSVYMDTPA